MKRGLFWCDVPGTFIEFCFMIFTEVLIKDSARMLIHVRESFNCRVSFKMLLPMFLVNFEKKFKQSCDQVTFRMLRSNKITKTVTKVVLNQASLFTVGSKQKWQQWTPWITWNRHSIKRWDLLKTRESHFPFVWDTNFLSVISQCRRATRNFSRQGRFCRLKTLR